MEIEEMKKAIQGLQEEEAKTLLFHFLFRINLLKETAYPKDEFVHDVEEIFETLIHLKKEQLERNQKKNFKMIHILLGDSQAGSLKVALKDSGAYQEEHVISFSDLFSIGPIWRLHEDNGKQARFEWLKLRMNDEYDEFDEYKLRFEKTVNEIQLIPEDVPITIWMAENAHEQTGLRYVMHLLKDRTNDINLINTTKMYGKLFNIKKYTVLHLHSGEIIPEKLQLIYENGWSPPLTQHEREDLEQEWLELANSRETLRIWRNDRLTTVSEDYYDQYMINMAKKLFRKRNQDEFIMSARLIGKVLGQLDQYVGDQFLEYRLRQLIEKGMFDMEGSLEAMRFYRIRLKK